ncbi:hypothetical protein ACFIJ5_05790 [Haloimpatiens sp. FM7330]|uniref:hypothetical protein n=1 Tax=Haloimpatiens sp. FM7330 TaxID=3298610 RepID=UPI00363EF782
MKGIKKGSTLCMVLIISSILIILGTAVLSLVLSSYKLSLIREKEKFNFYMSEAGLDKAYVEVEHMVNQGIKEGNNIVKGFMDNLDLQYEKEKEIYKNEEKKKVKGQGNIWTTEMEEKYGSPYIKDDLTVNQEYIKKEQNDKFKESYKKYIEDNILNIEDPKLYQYEKNKSIKMQIENNEENLIFNNDKIVLKLKSSYEKQDIEKVTGVQYEIKVPNYNDSYYVQTNTLKIPQNVIWQKALVVNKNLEVCSKDCIVNGDIFVKGEKDDKENSGIILNGEQTNIQMNGNACTLNDFLINSPKAMCNVSGNLYSLNTKLLKDADGSSLNMEKTKDSQGNLFTKDDLEINSENSSVDIEGSYYGLFDGSQSKNNTPDHSSSIIVNSNDLDSTKLNIHDECIIMGTAYIKTKKKYQTGESLALKGNYAAYTKPLKEGKLKEDNIEFEYYDPLVLASRFKDGDCNTNMDNDKDVNNDSSKKNNEDSSELNYKDKAQYFYEYYKQYKDDSGINLGKNITINKKKAFHIGDIITKEEGVITENYVIDINDKVLEKQNEFNKMVYYMGMEKEDDEYTEDISMINMDSQINYKELKKFLKHENKEEFNTDELILLDDNRDKNYALVGNNADTSKVTHKNVEKN